MKWTMELSEFDIVFKTRTPIKDQALADFVAEFAIILEIEKVMEPAEPITWNLLVDSSFGETGLKAGVVLLSPKSRRLNCAMRVGFKATNNVTEYEALLANIMLAKEM